jgi:hypothetical protein
MTQAMSLRMFFGVAWLLIGHAWGYWSLKRNENAGLRRSGTFLLLGSRADFLFPLGITLQSRRIHMDSAYDLFEIFPDGSALWRHTITCREAAITRLREFSMQTANEVRLIHPPTFTLIATMNTRVDGKPTDSTAG